MCVCCVVLCGGGEGRGGVGSLCREREAIHQLTDKTLPQNLHTNNLYGNTAGGGGERWGGLLQILQDFFPNGPSEIWKRFFSPCQSFGEHKFKTSFSRGAS